MKLEYHWESGPQEREGTPETVLTDDRDLAIEQGDRIEDSLALALLDDPQHVNHDCVGEDMVEEPN
jgi:hypothetical protein